MRVAAAAAAIAGLGTWSGCSFKSPAASPPDAAPDTGSLIDQRPPCASDATYLLDPVTRHRYKAPAQLATYDGSIDRCAADGAHLAVVDDLTENQFLASLLDGGGNNEGWLGLDDLTTEGMLAWVTGAPSAYRNFIGGDPNNNGNEDCVALRANGMWHDHGCEELKRPLCECDATYQVPPTPLCRNAAPPGSFEKSGRRVFTGPAMTWAEARDACKDLGAHLLVIGELAENMEIDQQLSDPYWIGYTDQQTEGTFRWVNHAPTPYWPGVAPANPDEDCVVWQNAGVWDDINCDELRMYACECDPLPP